MDNGKITKEQEKEDKSGKMALSTKDIGTMIWLMAKDDSSKQEVTSTKENGSMTKLKERESTSI